jgi:hypothetical protein
MYLFLALLILVTHNIAAADTCCWRHVKTEIAVPPNVSSKIVSDTWDNVFISREYGGGPELTDCPLSVEVGAPKAFIDYVFRGRLTATQTERGTNQFILRVQLVDKYRGKVIKEGQKDWFCLNEITCAKALRDNVMALAKSFQPLDDILHNYERMPEQCTIKPEREELEAGEEILIHIKDIKDNKGRPSQHFQRLLVKVEKGGIKNGVEVEGDYHVFEVADGNVFVEYQAPEECENVTERVTVFNSCEINDPIQATLKERKISEKKFDIVCNRLIVHITGTQSWTHEDRDTICQESTEVSVTGTMKLKRKRAYAESYEIGRLKASYKHYCKETDKRPGRGCTSLQLEASGSGTCEVKRGSVHITFGSEVSSSHPQQGSRLSFSFRLDAQQPITIKTQKGSRIPECNQYRTITYPVNFEIGVEDQSRANRDQKVFSGSRQWGTGFKPGTNAAWIYPLPFVSHPLSFNLNPPGTEIKLEWTFEKRMK